MKRLMVLMLAACFLFSGMAFAAEVKDKTGGVVKDKSGGDVKTKDVPAKVAKMKATGTVLAISDGALKLESETKGKKETLDFFLVKSFPDIKAGDKVNVTYVVKDGKNVAEKVSKVKEKVKAKEPAPKKAVEPGTPVKDKTGGVVKDKTGEAVGTTKK